MFSTALLVINRAIFVERTRKFGLSKATMVGFAGLVGLISKVEAIVEVIRIFGETVIFMLHAF